MYTGLGAGTGALVSGLIYNRFGARWAFGSTALALAAGWGLCAASQLCSAATAACGVPFND